MEKRDESYHERKAHTSPDFPYNTYLCTIPLDFLSVPAHWHEEAELIVIKKGEGRIAVDLTLYEVAAGEIVFVLPGQLHSIEQKGRAVMEYENILFRPELLEGDGADLCGSRFLQPVFAGMLDFSPHIHAGSPCFGEMASCIEQIDTFCRERPFGYQLAVKGLLFQMMFSLVTNHRMDDSRAAQKRTLEKVKLALSFIHENYTRPISVEEIAAACHYSQSHFMKFFKECMGLGFVRYLNDYRLGVASQMLLATDEGITEISGRTGFDSPSYFNRVFKRKYGVSPRQFRKEAGRTAAAEGEAQSAGVSEAATERNVQSTEPSAAGTEGELQNARAN